MTSSFAAIAPGRICLFGEHSDYLGFPVIARAIPLYCQIQVRVDVAVRASTTASEHISSNDDGDNDAKIVIHLHVPPELGESKVYDFSNLPPSPPADNDNKDPDFALAAIHEVLKEGWTLFPNNNNKKESSSLMYTVHCTSSSDYGAAASNSSSSLPVQAGCSSSTAFLVAWVLVLAQLACKAEELQRDPIRLATLAHRAEVLHFGNPGGTMDHVSIAYGTINKEDDDESCGAIRIGRDPWNVEPLPLLPSHGDDNGVWILADSGEPKDTMKHLKRCKHDRLQLVTDKLGGDWDCTSCASELTELEQRLWHATLVNRDTEKEAAVLWRNSVSTAAPSSGRSVGHTLALLMKQHHEALRDDLGLSTPRLEAMNEAALTAGAWAFKLVGSGGGGCGVAWAPRPASEAVAQAMKDAGAVNTWIMDGRQGVHGAHIVNS
mmetsp:Transcript_18612/g.34674  ORF Transcript_18612/g.34674 Transcript_18612/m.34674 type:complete len:435 (+) Transcript_18612:357-1661(+)